MARPRSDISERIRAAACERFLSDGVEGASLRAIAAAAKTSIGMVYYYYPTKDDLFFAVVEEAYAKVLADLSLALAPSASVEARLLRFYERLGALTEHELRVARMVLSEVLKGTERVEQLLSRFQTGHVALVARTVAEGLTDGTFDRARHPILIMMGILGLGGVPQLVARFAAQRLPFPGAPSGKALSAALVDVVLHGIAGPGKGAAG